MVSLSDYKFASWIEKYPDGIVKIKPDINTTWIPIFEKVMSNKKFKNVEEQLSEYVKGKYNIFPYPDLLFLAFKHTSTDNLKVVILGQDPYPNSEKGIPQGMGLSFSVPEGLQIPSSLQNIYINMKSFGHIANIPKHGNLEFIAKQGCLFLNTALTVAEGEKNSHSEIWKWFTNDLIKEISDNFENLVFVLWGAPALEKKKLIDCDKHKVVVSSHPSGLSYNKKLNVYGSFKETDHFGEINKYLISKNKIPLVYVQTL